ncbi:uncharacterized protein HKW66_Vig0005080 [Vigna angularis]|uniref:Uncharacterized protein n=2 Tax=Phaseolus angularis TaxID=3914 RepID=A0A8T0LHG4_PHAAN|nr:uncharacterized protein LOC108319409 [Vigna angularis]KAG2409843.1 uncharacterized protein HKW66_Vig0005080 [Vigna angularis]BAT74117.1 hypothetical protein VIGAN_01171700 [Vigna angularis var. angularis]
MSSHLNFFSSLKQVEKRLKLDQTSAAIESQIQESTLGSPIFLQSNCSQNCPSQDSSEPPQAFLSVPQEFPATYQNPSQIDHVTPVNEAEDDDDDDDDIEQLMQLLGLSEEQEQRDDNFDDCGSCHCEGGFYAKVVGVEGPKCRKEVVRLDGWIKHFLNGGGQEKLEPLRLAHLLLGKAAFVSDGGAYRELDFPSTIQEFLHTDSSCN